MSGTLLSAILGERIAIERSKSRRLLITEGQNPAHPKIYFCAITLRLIGKPCGL